MKFFKMRKKTRKTFFFEEIFVSSIEKKSSRFFFCRERKTDFVRFDSKRNDDEDRLEIVLLNFDEFRIRESFAQRQKIVR